MRIKQFTRSAKFTAGQLEHVYLECDESYTYRVCILNPIDMDKMIAAHPEAVGKITYVSHHDDRLWFFPKPDEDCNLRVRYSTLREI